LASGIKSKIDEYAGDPQTKEQKAAQAHVDALVKSYKDKYGNGLSHIATSFANDPASMLMDASAALTGGASAAGKIPGLARAAQVAGAVGRAVNPLNPMGIIGGGVRAPSPKSSGYLDASGKLTPEVDNAIQKMTNGRVGAADISDHSGFADVIGQKGVNEPALKEALLRQHVDYAPTPTVTGVHTDPTLIPEVNNRLAANRGQIADTYATIAGAPQPAPSALGAVLDDALAARNQAVQKRYNDIAAMPYTLHPDILQDFQPHEIPAPIERRLSASNLVDPGPGSYGRLNKMAYPMTSAAIDAIPAELGAVASSGSIPLRATERIRQQLNDLFASAKGSDRAGLRAVIDGYDESIEKAALGGKLLDATGTVAHPADAFTMAENMRGARAGYKDFQETFADRKGTAEDRMLANHSRELIAAQPSRTAAGMVPSGDDAKYMAVQAGMSKALLDPAKGPAFYDNLSAALGGNDANAAVRQAALRDTVRQSLLATPNGVPAIPPHVMDQHLRPGALASKVFDPKELSEIRVANENMRIMGNKVERARDGASLPSKVADVMTNRLLAGAAGHLAGGPLAGIFGVGAAEIAGHVIERLKAARQLRALEKGAPTPGSIFRTSARAASDFVTAPGRNRNLSMIDEAGHTIAPGQTNDETDRVLKTIKARESGDYKKVSSRQGVTASGAYQFTDDTWRRLTAKYGIGTEYNRAAKAPSHVQDAVASRYVHDILAENGGDVSKVPLVWYTGNPEGRISPDALALNGGLTPGQYQQKWLRQFSTASATGGRIARASGGRTGIDHEAEAERLIRFVETARKSQGKITRTLLHVPDEAITRALSIANKVA
jgi:Transglycosylase-like domain